MSMHGSSLDPYTRLLASVADAVTKARQSFPRTISGKLILLGIFFCAISFICVFLLLTSIIWGPILISTMFVYMSIVILRYFIDFGTDAFKRLKSKSLDLVSALIRSGRRQPGFTDDYAQQQQTQAAIKDHGFLRAIFETLPGVDADRALDRVPKLNLFRLSMHEAFHSAITRAPRSPESSDSSRLHRQSGETPAPCVSPIQELFDKGLLAPVDADWQLEEQASWQAIHPSAPCCAITPHHAARPPAHPRIAAHACPAQAGRSCLGPARQLALEPAAAAPAPPPPPLPQAAAGLLAWEVVALDGPSPGGPAAAAGPALRRPAARKP
jgi:hypothetical protein